MRRKDLIKAVASLRTSSAANLGADKGSEKRQRAAIETFARSAGYQIVDSYYDEAVSGADYVALAKAGFVTRTGRPYAAAAISAPARSTFSTRRKRMIRHNIRTFRPALTS